MYGAKNTRTVKMTDVWGGGKEFFVFTKLKFAAATELKMQETAQTQYLRASWCYVQQSLCSAICLEEV